MATQSNNYKVRLISVAYVKDAPAGSTPDLVNFDVTPSFQETGGVDYTTVNPIHMPGGIQVYKRTMPRTFTIGAKFVSRNMEEAAKNSQYLQILRSWRMPYFGNSSTRGTSLQGVAGSNSNIQAQANQPMQQSAPQQNSVSLQAANAKTLELLGAPPVVLYLYAYSTGQNDKRDKSFSRNVNRVPVVLTDLSITYPEDVDYIPIPIYSPSRQTISDGSKLSVDSTYSEPFPIKMDVSITLAETHSPHQYETFRLQDYKTGKMVNF